MSKSDDTRWEFEVSWSSSPSESYSKAGPPCGQCGKPTTTASSPGVDVAVCASCLKARDEVVVVNTRRTA